MNSSTNPKAVSAFAPLRLALGAAVALCAMASLPALRAAALYQDTFLWLIWALVALYAILLFLTVTLFHRETRRKLPPLERCRLLAALRLAFSCGVAGLVTAVVVSPGGRLAGASLWAAAAVLVCALPLLFPAGVRLAGFWIKAGRIGDYLFFQLALCVVLFELALRVWAQLGGGAWLERPDMEIATFIHHKRIASLQLNAFPQRANSAGYLDAEFSRERAPDEIRVALLADSFGAHYFPPEKLFPNIAEARLNAATDSKRWNVMNFSISAIGPREYQHLLEKELRHYRPDLYVLCLYPANDFHDMYVRELKPSHPLNPERWYFHLIPWKLSRAFRERRELAALRREGGGAAADRPDPQAPEPAPASSRSYLDRQWLSLTEFENQPDKQALIERELARMLEEARRITENRLLVLIIPSHPHVAPARFKALMRQHSSAWPSDNVYDLFERAQRACDTAGVAWRSLLEPLKRAEQTQPTYLANDIHWSEYGHQAVGRFLAEKLALWAADELPSPSTAGGKAKE